MAERELNDLLDTCCTYVDLQRHLLVRAIEAHSLAPPVVIAMHAALEQLETAVVHVGRPHRMELGRDPGE